MNWVPTSLGAEPKKIGILAALVAVAGGIYFSNNTGGPAAVPTPATPVTGVGSRLNQIKSLTQAAPARDVARRRENVMADFKPTLKLPEGTDVSRIDPALKLAMLSRLETLEFAGGGRSVFAFGAAPPPPSAAKPVAQVKPSVPVALPPPPPPPPTPAAPVKPAPPPIPLKFYGYVNGLPRRAFFLDGEDIFVAGENDLIRSRYRIIRIEAASALVEDTTTKSQQSLPLVQELPG